MRIEIELVRARAVVRRRIAATPGITAVDRTVDVTVQESGVTHFDLDLTAFAPATLEVVVTENGSGVPNLIIDVRASDESWMLRFPRTDEAGRTAGTCPAGVDVIVTATTATAGRASVVCASARVDLVSTDSNRVDLEVTSTAVELVFPAPWDPPGFALAYVAMRGPWNAPLTQTELDEARELGLPPEFLSRGMLTLQTAPGESGIVPWTNNPVRVEGVAPGEIEVVVQFWTGTSADDKEPREGLLRGRCVVEPSGSVRCELHVVE